MDTPLYLTMIYPMIVDGKGNKSILLARGLKGHSENKWNGYGGKVEPTDPTLLAAAAREFQEESKASVNIKDLNYVARIGYHHKHQVPGLGHPAKNLIMDVFFASKWAGIMRATETMSEPVEWPINNLPLEEMFESDQVWLPRILSGQRLSVDIWLEPNSDKPMMINSKTLKETVAKELIEALI